jgi:hypothetical protein
MLGFGRVKGGVVCGPAIDKEGLSLLVLEES